MQNISTDKICWIVNRKKKLEDGNPDVFQCRLNPVGGGWYQWHASRWGIPQWWTCRGVQCASLSCPARVITAPSQCKWHWYRTSGSDRPNPRQTTSFSVHTKSCTADAWQIWASNWRACTQAAETTALWAVCVSPTYWSQAYRLSSLKPWEPGGLIKCKQSNEVTLMCWEVNFMFVRGVSCLEFPILLISNQQFYPHSQFICNRKILEQVVKCKTYAWCNNFGMFILLLPLNFWSYEMTQHQKSVISEVVRLIVHKKVFMFSFCHSKHFSLH
jgi:hypothetical protein